MCIPIGDRQGLRYCYGLWICGNKWQLGQACPEGIRTVYSRYRLETTGGVPGGRNAYYALDFCMVLPFQSLQVT
jgi:hypothetical protein